jgi:hypothetical protein
MGVGWRLTRHDTGARIDHGGALPGYRSSLLLDPSSRVGVILLINADDGPLELSVGILKLVAEPIRKAAASSPAAVPTPSTEFARFQGLYRSRTGSQLFVLAVNGGLQLLEPEAADNEAIAAMLRRTGPTSFMTESPPGSITRFVASRVQFTLDESGQEVSFTTDDGAYRFRRVR